MVCEEFIGNTLVLFIKIAWVSETMTANSVVSLDIVSHLKPQMFLKNFGTLSY